MWISKIVHAQLATNYFPSHPSSLPPFLPPSLPPCPAWRTPMPWISHAWTEMCGWSRCAQLSIRVGRAARPNPACTHPLLLVWDLCQVPSSLAQLWRPICERSSSSKDPEGGGDVATNELGTLRILPAQPGAQQARAGAQCMRLPSAGR